ncbi:MFS transporter [Acidipila sp. EB88]|uniref:MFS transporter n=1 Tax=Acidipila sp. EB88 TaxID=2305226 RepID=UPI000F5EE339|nr:MFS transporter [Acidipila sp. EB88]RRA48740.1 MFS transporter [Acidipila sp. EB88]
MQRIVLALLFAAGSINFLDRGSLSIANGPIRSELHLSGSHMGALLSFFSLAYGLAQLPVGALLDRFRARLLLGGGLLLWSAAQAATALVRSFAQFVPLRLLLGVGEAPFFAAGVQSIEGWFAPGERGWPTGLMNASTMLGQAIAPPVLTVLMLHGGWRSMFAVIGALGVLLALCWFPLYRDPPAPALPGPRQTRLPQHSTASTLSVRQWIGFFRSATMWGMLLGFSGINYTAWLYMAWLPGYLEEARHVSVARTGALSVVPFLLGACGMFLSGLLADALVRRGQDPLRCRRWIVVSGMVLSAAFTFFVAGAGSTRSAVLLIAAALFCVHFAGTAAWGIVQFAAPAGRVATIASIQNFGSFMVASVAPWLTGWLLDRTHAFALALSLCSAVTLVGAAAYATLVRRPIEAAPAPAPLPATMGRG